MSQQMSPPKPGGRAVWWVALVAVVAAGLVIAISLIGSQKETTTRATTSDAKVHANRSLMGDPAARVKLVEYSDFL